MEMSHEKHNSSAEVWFGGIGTLRSAVSPLHDHALPHFLHAPCQKSNIICSIFISYEHRNILAQVNLTEVASAPPTLCRSQKDWPVVNAAGWQPSDFSMLQLKEIFYVANIIDYGT